MKKIISSLIVACVLAMSFWSSVLASAVHLTAANEKIAKTFIANVKAMKSNPQYADDADFYDYLVNIESQLKAYKAKNSKSTSKKNLAIRLLDDVAKLKAQYEPDEGSGDDDVNGIVWTTSGTKISVVGNTSATDTASACKKDVDANCNGIYDHMSPEWQDCSVPDKTGVDFSPTTCFYKIATAPATGGTTPTSPKPTPAPTGCPVPDTQVIYDNSYSWENSTAGSGHSTTPILKNGQSLAIKFTAGTSGAGNFSTVEYPAVGPDANRYATISKCPGDFSSVTPNDGSYCAAGFNSTGGPLNFSVKAQYRNYCTLQPGQTYYYNIRHATRDSSTNTLKESCSHDSGCAFFLDLLHN